MRGIKSVKKKNISDALFNFYLSLIAPMNTPYYSDNLFCEGKPFNFIDDEIEENIKKLASISSSKYSCNKKLTTGKIKVSVIASSLIDGGGHSNFIINLLKYGNKERFDYSFWSTELASSKRLGKNKLDEINKIGTPVNLQDTSGNFEDRAKRLADNLNKLEIDVGIFFHAPQDTIALFLASLRPIPYLINTFHADFRLNLGRTVFDYFIFFNESSLKLWKKYLPDDRCFLVWIGSDAHNSLRSSKEVDLSKYGIDKNIIVTATFCAYRKIINYNYLNAIKLILKNNPDVYHIIAGLYYSNEKKFILHFFSSEKELQKRIILFDNQNDLSGFYRRIDVYLDSFPHWSPSSVLEAMAYGKPVVCNMQFRDLVSSKECIGEDENEYVEIANVFIRNKDLREEIGKKLQKRYYEKFTAEKMAKKMEEVIESITFKS